MVAKGRVGVVVGDKPVIRCPSSFSFFFFFLRKSDSKRLEINQILIPKVKSILK
jgi:hypothetical protein